MLVLASQALLIPYHEEGTLALASVGEGHTDTCILAGMGYPPLMQDIAIHTGAGVMLYSTGIRIGILKGTLCFANKIEIEIDCLSGRR